MSDSKKIGPQVDINKYRTKEPEPVPQVKQQEPPKRELSKQEQLQNAREDQRFAQERLGDHAINFNYLDLYERQIEEKRQAMAEFSQQRMVEEKSIEDNKPAFFQKGAEKPTNWREEEFEAWKKLQKSTEMNFNPDGKTHEQLREFFKVPEGKGMVDDMNEKMFEHMQKRLKTRQLTFYAFLNKEFNTMNYKSARCSKHCFDQISKPLSEVNSCLSVCRQGIMECSDFAHNLQKESHEALTKCQVEAKMQENLTDPVIHWMSCYEQLLLRFDKIENRITDEFSNFI